MRSIPLSPSESSQASSPTASPLSPPPSPLIIPSISNKNSRFQNLEPLQLDESLRKMHAERMDCDSHKRIESKCSLDPILTERFSIKTRRGSLPNGLNYYLYSSPYLRDSAAALIVKAGSYHDPKELPGLAHFVEHMIFHGSDKYSDKSFDSHIEEYSGSHNASTHNDYTHYYFSCDDSGLEKGLDIMSSLLSKPLFDTTKLEEEVKLIDSEWNMHKTSSYGKAAEVLKQFVNEDHPEKAFHCGNAKSLEAITANYEAVRKWQEAHYSANVTTLCIYSKKELDHLENELGKTFSQMPNRNLSSKKFTAPAYQADALGQLVWLDSEEGSSQLAISWKLEEKFSTNQWRSDCEAIAFVMGHEGEGSLLSQLIKEDLATSCGVSAFEKRAEGFYEFSLLFTLNEKGLNQPESIIQRVFQSLARLKKEGISKEILAEIKQESKNKYLESVPSSALKMAANCSHILDSELENYPEKAFIPEEQSQRKIQEILESLEPEKAIYSLSSNQENAKIALDKFEESTKTAYGQKDLRPFLETCKTLEPHPAIHSLKANPYCAKNLFCKTGGFEKAKPGSIITYNLRDDDRGRVSFSPSPEIPKHDITWKLSIYSKAVQASQPKSILLNKIFCQLLEEAMREEAYIASCASLNIEFGEFDNGIQLALAGFDEKAQLLLEKTLKKLSQFTFDEASFYRERKKLIDELKNQKTDQAYEKAHEYLDLILRKDELSAKKCIRSLNKSKPQDLSDFLKNIFDYCYLDVILTGNMGKAEQEKVSDLIFSHFSASKPYPKAEHYKEKVAKIEGSHSLTKQSKEDSNAVSLCFPLKDTKDIVSDFSFTLLYESMNQQFFQTLREEQQAGYITFVNPHIIQKKRFLSLNVQSSNFSCEQLADRFELFLDSYKKRLLKGEILTQEQFEIKKAIQSFQFNVPIIQNQSKLLRIESMLRKHEGNLEYYNQYVQILPSITYENFIEECREMLSQYKENKLAIFVKGEVEDEYQNFESVQSIRENTGYEVKKARTK